LDNSTKLVSIFEKVIQINKKKSKPENITKPYRAIDPESKEAK